MNKLFSLHHIMRGWNAEILMDETYTRTDAKILFVAKVRLSQNFEVKF
jgi:hypothetical protein